MNLARTLGNLLGMSLVNLMINFYIGEVEISTDVQDELLLTVRTAVDVSLALVFASIIFSLSRWRRRKQSE
jgi:hypothetical protein